nr:NUDIX domain-containing protein [Nocardia sp. GTS18]
MVVREPRIRAAAYVIREGGGPELLVFDHAGMPEAGTQIPAGGVHLGERLEEAVLREVFEETGLREVSIVEELAVDDRAYPVTGQQRSTTYFHLRAGPETPGSWLHRVEGEGVDSGMLFACRFVGLPLDERLADHQDAWLSLLTRP